MKLYTEEQVRQMLQVCEDRDLYEEILTFDDVLKTQTPIELPSDEEVEQYLKSFPYTKHLDDGQYNDGQLAGFELGAEWAFQKALELIGDKKFSEEDVKNLIDNFHSIYEDGFGVASDNKKQRASKLIQSLQQTEWDVEFEMEKYGRCELCLKAGMWHCAHADTCGSAVEAERPKLDTDGWLILKRTK